MTMICAHSWRTIPVNRQLKKGASLADETPAVAEVSDGIPVWQIHTGNFLHFYHYIYDSHGFFDFDGSDDTLIFAEVFKISKL